MRLISCHIENFGKLHDLDLSFSDGLNVICRENGWGKSTLAAFIKALLYGLDGGKKRDLDENERKRFYPWQGGVFGGRLDFAIGEKRYSVTRTFGDSPTKDTFELRDSVTNLISQDYSEHLGDELFKLNSASFYRSIFIGQNDCQTSSTDEIHAKIGNLADNTGDLNSYESADKRLKSQINALSPKLKSGLLFKLSAEIAELRRKVAEGNKLSEDIVECENKIAEAEKQKKATTAEISDLETKQKQAIRTQELISLRSEWDRLKKSCEVSKKALDTVNVKFSSGIPDEDAVKSNIHMSVEMKSAESLMHSYRLSEHEECRFTQLKDVFEKEVPSSDDFERYFNLEKELRRVRDKYNMLGLTDEEQDRFILLSETFANDTMTPSELSAKWSECEGLKNSIGSKRAAYAAIAASVRKTRSAAKRRSFFLTATGSAVILTALALFAYYSDVRVLIGAIAGIVFLAAGIFSYTLMLGIILKKTPDELLQLRTEIAWDERIIIETDALVENYLSKHGMSFDETGVPLMLEELCEEKRDFEILRKKNDTAETYRRENNFTALNESIGAFLEKYKIQPDCDRLSDQIHELKEATAEYELLSDKQRQFETAQQVYHSDKEAIRQFLDNFGIRYDLDVYEALERLRNDLAERSRLSALHSAASGELASFEQSHDISALKSLDNENIPSLESISDAIRGCSETMEGLNDLIHTLRQSREELYKHYAVWESECSTLREKTETLASEKSKYERLLLTRELLRRAKENMVARYVEPIYNAFRRYHRTVTGILPDNYHIDADVNLTVEELGQQREVKSLSTGFRDLAGICLRLGLADAMYCDEKPMLILDDPFTNLDDDKAAASKKLLQVVSESYQVIYFTCSKTRK